MSLKIVPVVAFAGLLICADAAAAETMTLDFSWRGSKGCVTLFPNPEIRLRNIPAGARSLTVELTQGTRELGGQELPIPDNGMVPSGAIRTFAPCNPGIYRWTVVAKSPTGQVLSQAHLARSFPGDELAPDKP